MKLSEIMDIYISFKRGLGVRFLTDAKRLHAFCRAVGDVEISDVDPDLVVAYINGQGPVTAYWHHKYKVLNRFYRFAINRGYAASSPLPVAIPKKNPQSFVPYIYSQKEFHAIVVNAPQVCLYRNSKLQGDTFSIMLLVLWGTGLRIGEALRLKMKDVNLEDNLLIINDTKFFKSRIVPMDPHLTQELSKFLAMRRKRPCPKNEESVVFCTRRGEPIPHDSAERHFRKLCEKLDVRRTDGARYQPRIHDIRHSFALNRLLSWYRKGADVQRLLPHLSTYLGHVSLASTQCYLTATSELLTEASLRFERYAKFEVTDG